MSGHKGLTIRRKDVDGIHPFEKLCHECQFADCHPGSPQCLQRQVIGGDPLVIRSFYAMTKAMVSAKLANMLVGIDIPDELLKEYPDQFTKEELLQSLDHPEYFGLK